MDTSLPIEAKFSLTYAERLQATFLLTLSSPAALLWLSPFPIFGIVLLLLGVPTTENPIVGWFALIGCFGFVPFIFLANTFNAHRTDRARGPYTYRFDADGLQVLSSTSELKQSWAAIPRVREQKGILFLYFGKRCAHCVPTRAFSSPLFARSIENLASGAGVSRVGT